MVSGIGGNLFSVPTTTEQEATTIFALEESRIETTNFTIPLQHVGDRRDLYTLNIELGGVDFGTACGGTVAWATSTPGIWSFSTNSR